MIILSLQYLTKDEGMIKKGDKFRCIKDFNKGSELLYKKGKIYLSNSDECIITESGYNHMWSNCDNLLLGYLIPYISNKRRGYGRKEGKKV